MATYIARIVSAVTLGRGGRLSPSPADLETIAWRALAGHGLSVGEMRSGLAGGARAQGSLVLVHVLPVILFR